METRLRCENLNAMLPLLVLLGGDVKSLARPRVSAMSSTRFSCRPAGPRGLEASKKTGQLCARLASVELTICLAGNCGAGALRLGLLIGGYVRVGA